MSLYIGCGNGYSALIFLAGVTGRPEKYHGNLDGFIEEG
jgi:hypothetical protein